MNVLDNPDPRRYREARVCWDDLFTDRWPDGIPCFIERSSSRWFIVPLFTRTYAEQLAEFYNSQPSAADTVYRWAEDTLLICWSSDDLDAEDNGNREFATIDEVQPADGLYHLDPGMLWNELPHVDDRVEALRHQDAAVARGQALTAQKELVRRLARSVA